MALERPNDEKNASLPPVLGLTLAGVGVAVFAMIVNLVASVYLITYEDTYEASKGPLWSLTSMTHPQQVAYVIAVYGVPAMLVVGAGLVVYAIARRYRARKQQR